MNLTNTIMHINVNKKLTGFICSKSTFTKPIVLRIYMTGIFQCVLRNLVNILHNNYNPFKFEV